MRVFLISKTVLKLIYYDFDDFALIILNAYKYFKIIILRYRNRECVAIVINK